MQEECENGKLGDVHAIAIAAFSLACVRFERLHDVGGVCEVKLTIGKETKGTYRYEAA